MNGYDAQEHTSLNTKDVINPEIWNKKDLKGVKVGIPKEYFEE
jgi:Asp-tRNA(Asn)/Glu-tRNA(Gln) amidotransferase A subunit family amidase